MTATRSIGARCFTLAAVLGVSLLGGCALKPPPSTNQIQSRAMPAATVPSGWSGSESASGTVRNNWLRSFNNPQLQAFVEQVIAGNPNLQLAAARVEQAAAVARMAGATMLPQVSMMARGGGALGGDSSGLQGFGLFVDWEIDLWGRIRAGRAAASGQYEAAQLDAAFARQSIAALAAKGWFLALELARQRELAEQLSASAEQLVVLARARARIGRADEFEVRRSSADLQRYRDAVAQLDLAHEQALRALKTLAGQYPDAQLKVSGSLGTPPQPVPVGLPSELLERRLDLIAAQRRVSAAFYRTEEAQAARLPRISLTAGATSISSELFLLKERENPVWSAGVGLLAPVYLGGQLQAQLELRTAEQKQAIAAYGQLGAQAFSEVENALSAGFNLDFREKLLEQAVRENEAAHRIASTRYRVGSVDQRTVLNQTIALNAAQTALLRVQAERMIQRVTLHLALGGDFN